MSAAPVGRMEGKRGRSYARVVLTPARAVMLVICLAAVVRVWFVPGIPLVITNDGTGYLHWAVQLLEGEAMNLPPFRTPGYPLFLAGVFLTAGVSPFAVLVAQNILAVATCGLVAFASARLAGPRVALVMGGLLALDPWLLGFSFYALTELLSAFLLVLAGTLLLTAVRANLGRAIVIGLVLAMLVLVRPAFQVVVPVFVVGWLLAFSLRSRQSVLTAAAMAAAFLLAVAPWLWHNHQRGVNGFSGGGSAYLWFGAAGAQILDDDYPLPENIRASYERHARGTSSNVRLCTFLAEVRGWHDPETGELLQRWALHSIRSDPREWGRAFVFALGWQLGYFPRHGVVTDSFARWQLWRLTQDGRERGADAVNFQFTNDLLDTSRFAMFSPPGPQRHYFSIVSRYRDLSLVRVGFLGLAVVALILAVLRGRWTIAAVLGASIGYYLIHAAFLFSEDRYSFPSWIVWYAAPAALVAALRRRGAQPPATAPVPQADA